MKTRLAAASAAILFLFAASAVAAEKQPKKTSAKLSPTGRKALSRYQPAAEEEVSSNGSSSNASNGADTRPVTPVHTKPLREMRVIPPPRPGEAVGRNR